MNIFSMYMCFLYYLLIHTYIHEPMFQLKRWELHVLSDKWQSKALLNSYQSCNNEIDILSLYNSIVTLETCFNLINFLIDIKTFPEYNYANNLISFGNEWQDNIARWRWYIMQSTSRFLKCVIATVSEYVYALTKLLNIIDA